MSESVRQGDAPTESTTERQLRSQPSRRDVVAATATGTVAATGAVIVGRSSDDGGRKQSSTTVERDPRHLIYRETPHIRNFYTRCRF